jgi:hypothetical protein
MSRKIIKKLAHAFTLEEYETIAANAVRSNPMNLKLCYLQSNNVCMIAVKLNGLALQYVQEEITLDVNTNVYDLCPNNADVAFDYYYSTSSVIDCYNNGRTSELCEIAVQQNGLALQYVDYKTDKICLLALKQNMDALRFIRKITPVVREYINTHVHLCVKKTQ